MQLSSFRKPAGFTLVEIMVVSGILGILAFIAIPGFQRAKQRAQATLFASEMRSTIESFQIYQGEHGQLPPPKLTYFTPPDSFNDYLPKNSTWTSYSVMGGAWVWMGDFAPLIPGRDEVLGVYIPGASDAQLLMADQTLDDGNLATGNFRRSGAWYFAAMDNKVR